MCIHCKYLDCSESLALSSEVLRYTNEGRGGKIGILIITMINYYR